jgi:hypothetical protein
VTELRGWRSPSRPTGPLQLADDVAAVWTRPQVVALATAAVGLLGYLVAHPQAPDLAAQVARSAVARGTGGGAWWVGWFGGLELPSYSVLGPLAMAVVGPPLAATVAVLASVVAMADLMRGTRRPAVGAAAFAVMAVANVVAGRVTFALALAVGLLGLAALRRGKWLAVVLALGCVLLSPLAAFFLGVAALAVVVTDRARRALAAATAGILLAVASADQILFSHTGTMPYGVTDILGASVTALAVAVLVPNRTVRVGALLMTVVPFAVMAHPGALGENVVRLTWLVAAPTIVAAAATPRRWLVAMAAVATAAWPLAGVAGQVASSHDPSARTAFYPPLERALASQIAAAGPGAIGERVEVIPTRTHWETSYLVEHVQLARGWDRQADVADNPLFYADRLTAADYRSWLRTMAVGWVARPRTPLDHAGVTEAGLVDKGQPYLHLVWQNPSWDLYQVTPAAPLAHGATVVRVTANTVVLGFTHAGRARIQLRWTPYLVVKPASTSFLGRACAEPAGQFVAVTVTTPGDYTVSADFRPLTPACSLTAR